MKSSLSESTYILLTAKISNWYLYFAEIVKHSKRKLVCRFGHTIKKKQQKKNNNKKTTKKPNKKHSHQKGSFIFLKFMTNWWMKMHLKMTLGHKLAVAMFFFYREKRSGDSHEI